MKLTAPTHMPVKATMHIAYADGRETRLESPPFNVKIGSDFTLSMPPISEWVEARDQWRELAEFSDFEIEATKAPTPIDWNAEAEQ